MKTPKITKDSIVKIQRRVLLELHKFQIILISAFVLFLLSYAVVEVGRVANTSITPEQEVAKQTELASKRIEFDQETISKIQLRLDEDIQVQAQDLGTENPFQTSN